jgi:TBC1 domain family member 2
MTLTQLEEFRDIMYTDNFVDLSRLKTCALHGVPPEIRAEVWKYLLDVSKLDKSEEVSLSKMLVENYEEMAEASQNDMEILRKVKAQLRSYKSPLWESALDAKGRKMMERVAVCYLAQNPDLPYDDALSITHFLPPFVYCAQEESDAYYCFQSLMQRISIILPYKELRLRMARFIMLFKTLFPEINAALEGMCTAYSSPIQECADFEPKSILHSAEEGVEPNEWAVSWLHFLLCRELPVECSMRLWDAYLGLSASRRSLAAALSPLAYELVREGIGRKKGQDGGRD